METQISRGERTRLEIMDSALDLFNRQGYHGTSVRQIAEQAEIALGGIYNHFSSKEEIYQAVVLEYHPVNYMLPQLEQIQEETIEQFVRRVAGKVFVAMQANQSYLNLIFVELVEFRGRHLPGLLKQVFPRSLEFARHIREKKGKLRDIPLPMMVASFVGLIFFYVFFSRFFQRLLGEQSTDEGLEHILDIFLYGILEKETQS
jgi:TetR/AcrR family transcriptional regulator of autoinduction and epiphytic fitness